MAALDADLVKIVQDDRSIVDPRTGNRNEFLRGVGRKLDLTVTGFNAFRSDPQLKQIRIDLADRAEKTTITGAKGIVISCPDAQLQMALRGVVRAIDQLPELDKPRIAAVEGSEATIEAFRRLTATFFGLLTFKLPPSADELRELQRKAVQSVEGSGPAGAPAALRAVQVEQAAGLARRDYVPLAVAIFVDLCLLLVSIGRPVNQFMGLERSLREAEVGPVYPILARFHDIHADAEAVRHFDVFRDVIFDINGHYHVAVPLNIPKSAPDYESLQREAHRLANLCYALEGKGILTRPISFVPPLLAHRQLARRGSKFVECYGRRRPARYRRGWDAVRSLWTEIEPAERPAFKVYRFRKGAWPEMILGAVMGAARHQPARRPAAANGHRQPPTRLAMSTRLGEPRLSDTGAAEPHDPAFGRYQHRHVEGEEHELPASATAAASEANGHDLLAMEGTPADRPPLGAEPPERAPASAGGQEPSGNQLIGALARLLRARPAHAQRDGDGGTRGEIDDGAEPERIAGRFSPRRSDA